MKFKQWLKENPQDENTTEIDCSSSRLTDLKGIRQYTKLIKLDCSNNNLTELPNLPLCEELICGGII